jgi:hypothetical protein
VTISLTTTSGDYTSLMQCFTESTGNTTSYLYDKLNRLTRAGSTWNFLEEAEEEWF